MVLTGKEGGGGGLREVHMFLVFLDSNGLWVSLHVHVRTFLSNSCMSMNYAGMHVSDTATL